MIMNLVSENSSQHKKMSLGDGTPLTEFFLYFSNFGYNALAGFCRSWVSLAHIALSGFHPYWDALFPLMLFWVVLGSLLFYFFFYIYCMRLKNEILLDFTISVFHRRLIDAQGNLGLLGCFLNFNFQVSSECGNIFFPFWKFWDSSMYWRMGFW